LLCRVKFREQRHLQRSLGSHEFGNR
jgi:hypothetical protein